MLYASVDDVYIDNFAAFFGAELESRDQGGSRAGGDFLLDGDRFRLELPWNVRRKYRAAGAEILGRDSESNPVFFEHAYGRGKVFFVTFPLEKLMMEQPLSYSSPASGSAWKIYRHLSGLCATEKCAVKNDPFLSLTEHHMADGTVVLAAVNLLNYARRIEFRLSDGRKLDKVYPAEVAHATGGVIQLDLPGNGGALCVVS